MRPPDETTMATHIVRIKLTKKQVMALLPLWDVTEEAARNNRRGMSIGHIEITDKDNLEGYAGFGFLEKDLARKVMDIVNPESDEYKLIEMMEVEIIPLDNQAD